MSDLEISSIASWHRRYCEVADWLAISGDLSPNPAMAASQLAEWVDQGITDIVDVRGEWSDESVVAALAPGIRYHHLGTHDDGTSQSLAWFQEGVTVLHEALAHGDAKVMVHCHMGVNRGPSMAFAYLLDQGWEPVAALDAIRQARPIAAILYAKDAVVAQHRRNGNDDTLRQRDLVAVQEWNRANGIDVATVIRRIRQAEH